MNVVYGLQEFIIIVFGYNGVYIGDCLVLEFDVLYLKVEISFEGDDIIVLYYIMFDVDGVC